jgi:hypothetical protein
MESEPSGDLKLPAENHNPGNSSQGRHGPELRLSIINGHCNVGGLHPGVFSSPSLSCPLPFSNTPSSHPIKKKYRASGCACAVQRADTCLKTLRPVTLFVTMHIVRSFLNVTWGNLCLKLAQRRYLHRPQLPWHNPDICDLHTCSADHWRDECKHS